MLKYCSKDYLAGQFKAFSLPHIAALFVILLLNIGMVLWFKKVKDEKTQKLFCYVLGGLLIFQEIVREVWHMSIGIFSLGRSLPLHLCGAAIILGPLMLIKKNYSLYEILYFWGFGGTIQALITPNCLWGFPHLSYFLYFISHGLIILACVYMTFVEKFRPTWISILKVFIVTNIYMGFIAIVNLLTGGNYMFICDKPETPSIIDYLGPWPWYILSLEGVGIVTFFIYYSPFFIKDIITSLRITSLRKKSAKAEAGE